MTNQSASWPDLRPRLDEASRQWEVRDAGVTSVFGTVEAADAFVVERVAAADPAVAQALASPFMAWWDKLEVNLRARGARPATWGEAHRRFLAGDEPGAAALAIAAARVDAWLASEFGVEG